MAINLQKGQRISLKKEAPNLKQLICGLGWDVAKSEGLFGFLGVGQNVDLDASVLCLNDSNNLEKDKDIIYFGNLRHYSDAITHLGDNLTGAGEGDDEQIIVNLPQVPANISKLVFTVNIYDAFNRRQEFSQVKNAFVRLVDLGTNKEIARYTLSGSQYQDCTGLILAEVYRQEDDWKMAAKGEGVRVKNLREIADQYY